MDPVSTVTEAVAAIDVSAAIDAVGSLAQNTHNPANLVGAVVALIAATTPAIIFAINKIGHRLNIGVLDSSILNSLLPFFYGALASVVVCLQQGISPVSAQGLVMIVSGVGGGAVGTHGRNIVKAGLQRRVPQQDSGA